MKITNDPRIQVAKTGVLTGLKKRRPGEAPQGNS